MLLDVLHVHTSGRSLHSAFFSSVNVLAMSGIDKPSALSLKTFISVLVNLCNNFFSLFDADLPCQSLDDTVLSFLFFS